jgi:glycosyltransferase involved in cell wall biosynthesis
MKNVLFITAGPYFWPHQKTQVAKYELYSEHFGGYIFSFVSKREWRRVDVGNFKLIGFPVSDRVYANMLARTVLRAILVLTNALFIHFFRKRIDFIITWDPHVTGFLGLILSRLTGARLIVEVNGDLGKAENWGIVRGGRLLDRLKYRYVHWALPFIVNRAHGVKLLYPWQLDPFRGLKHPERLVAFHDLVPISQYRPGKGRTQYGLFVGHPWHRKGIDVLVKAFDRVSARHPDYTLKIVGLLPEKEKHRDLWAHNPQIEFLPPVMPEKVVDLMAECSFFVLASRSEGMPRVLMEAMAAHKPIIASAVSGIPFYIQDGETGLLFPNEDVDALAAALDHIMSDEVYAAWLGENGFRYASTELSERRHIEKLLALFDQVTRERSPDVDTHRGREDGRKSSRGADAAASRR